VLWFEETHVKGDARDCRRALREGREEHCGEVRSAQRAGARCVKVAQERVHVALCDAWRGRQHHGELREACMRALCGQGGRREHWKDQ
jgi:hypothetical protein